jgi:protocatechuate 3,4-dioxygenase beta subunit
MITQLQRNILINAKTQYFLRTTIVFCFFITTGASMFSQTDESDRLPSRSTGKGLALCASCDPPKKMSSVVTLPPEGEKGEPVVIIGTVYKKNGVTPDSGVVLFLYQTDAGGYYHRPNEDVFAPRIRGWLRTGKDGRYEFRTIKPAPEILDPNGPAHIHVHVFGDSIPEHFLHEFWFERDKRIKQSDAETFGRLGNFSPIIHLTQGKDGIWRGVRNIRLGDPNDKSSDEE